MEYPNIIALINARLALLQQARDLLLPPSIESAPARRKRRERPTGISKSFTAGTEQASSEPSQEQQPPSSPPIPRLPPVVLRDRVPRGGKIAAPERSAALAGTVPATPVAISPAQVQAQETQRRSLETKQLAVPATDSVEPAQIARKWLENYHDDHSKSKLA